MNIDFIKYLQMHLGTVILFALLYIFDHKRYCKIADNILETINEQKEILKSDRKKRDYKNVLLKISVENKIEETINTTLNKKKSFINEINSLTDKNINNRSDFKDSNKTTYKVMLCNFCKTELESMNYNDTKNYICPNCKTHFVIDINSTNFVGQLN